MNDTAWISDLGKEDPGVSSVARRIEEVRRRAAGEEAEETPNALTDAEVDEAAALLLDRVRETALLEEPAPADPLAAGIEAWARDAGVTPGEVEAALAGPDGWELLGQVLELGFAAVGEAEWLNEPEGRNGAPLTKQEAGLGRTEKTEGAEVVPIDPGRAKKTRSRWWSRAG